MIRGSLNRAETLGVQSFSVILSYTSQTCPLCGYVSKLNRDGERFTQEPIVPEMVKPDLEYFSKF